MKKSLIFAASMLFATTAFVGCTNEDALSFSNELKVEASMGLESRTQLGNDYKTVTWCQDDLIYLFGDGADATMHLISGADTEVGTFTGTVNGFPNKLTKALYPVPTIENGVYSYDLLADRDYSKNSAAPLFGPFVDGKIQYENLVAMMRIPLSASNQERVLVLKMAGISGKLIVNVENGTAEMETGATDQVTVTIPAGNACCIDIPVPAKNYSNGYKITLDGVILAEENGSVDLTNPNKVQVVLIEPSTSNPDPESGIVADYYIATSADLLWVANQVNNEGNNFNGKKLVMTEDIDLNGIDWEPIGKTEPTAFRGAFDGQEHTISNLQINATSCSGLFGYVGRDSGSNDGNIYGSIRNLKVHNATVNTTSGAVVCGNLFRGEVSGIELTGKVTVEGNAQNLAGVVGYHYGNLFDITVNVTADSYVKSTTGYCAGVAGYSGEGDYVKKNITSNINVTGAGEAVGGVFVLLQYGNSAINCSSSGNVTNITPVDSHNRYIRTGGLVGCWVENNAAQTTITGCSYTGKVIASRTDGLNASLLPHNGLVGLSYSTSGIGGLNIDGKLYRDVYKSEGLAEAVKLENVTVFMSAGPWGGGISITPYAMPVKISKGVIIEGVKEAVLDMFEQTRSSFNNVTFKGIRIKEDNKEYNGIQSSSNIKYVDCIIDGMLFSYSSNAVFEGCIFNQSSADAYNIWTYGSDNITFTDCEFNCAGKSVLIYKEALTDGDEYTVTFDDCRFNASAPIDGKAAIEIDSSFPNNPDVDAKYIININKTTVKGFANGSVSGNPLWNQKKGNKTTLYVDGVQKI